MGLGEIRNPEDPQVLTVNDLAVDALIETALGNITGRKTVDRFGYSPSIGTSYEDVWDAGTANYTGFNATAGENLQLAAQSGTADAGTVLSSGTATGGSSTTLIDTGANFTGDGVAVGDVAVNDTTGDHGVITSVTSDTLTLQGMAYGGNWTGGGDSYRIVTAASTGCALVRLDGLLDSNYDEQTPEYIVTNGTTYVDTSGSDYIRCSSGEGILFGSGNENAQKLICRQKVTTSNLFFAIGAGDSKALVAAYTIPAGYTGWLLGWECSLAGGTGGDLTADLRARPYGQGFLVMERISTRDAGSSMFQRPSVAPKGPYHEFTDIKVRALSDTASTKISGGFSLLLVAN